MPASALKEIKSVLDGLRLPGQDKTSKSEIGNGLVSRRFRVFDYPEFFSKRAAMDFLERRFSGRKVRIREEGDSWLAVEVAPQEMAATATATVMIGRAVLRESDDAGAGTCVEPPPVNDAEPQAIGRTAAEVTDINEIRLVALAYVPGVNGFKQVERQFGLRPANGMTAYRIVQKAIRSGLDPRRFRRPSAPGLIHGDSEGHPLRA